MFYLATGQNEVGAAGEGDAWWDSELDPLRLGLLLEEQGVFSSWKGNPVAKTFLASEHEEHQFAFALTSLLISLEYLQIF